MKKESKNKEIVDLILKKNKGELITGRDVTHFFDDLYGDIIQALLEGEMEDFIGYKKGEHEEKETENRRNGYSSNRKNISQNNMSKMCGTFSEKYI